MSSTQHLLTLWRWALPTRLQPPKRPTWPWLHTWTKIRSAFDSCNACMCFFRALTCARCSDAPMLRPVFKDLLREDGARCAKKHRGLSNRLFHHKRATRRRRIVVPKSTGSFGFSVCSDPFFGAWDIHHVGAPLKHAHVPLCADPIQIVTRLCSHVLTACPLPNMIAVGPANSTFVINRHDRNFLSLCLQTTHCIL